MKNSSCYSLHVLQTHHRLRKFYGVADGLHTKICFRRQVYSGSSTSGVLLHKYCNTSHPEPLTTPENHAVVVFHSDEAASDAGFQIHYTVVEGDLHLQLPQKAFIAFACRC